MAVHAAEAVAEAAEVAAPAPAQVAVAALAAVLAVPAAAPVAVEEVPVQAATQAALRVAVPVLHHRMVAEGMILAVDLGSTILRWAGHQETNKNPTMLMAVTDIMQVVPPSHTAQVSHLHSGSLHTSLVVRPWV